MPRTLLLLMLVPLMACPPVLGDDDDAVADDDDAADDDDSTSSGDLEDIYDGMNDGGCDVIPDNDSMLPNGAGIATEGLWYEVRCIWTGGNASEITVQLNYFDSFGGGDFEVTGMVACRM